MHHTTDIEKHLFLQIAGGDQAAFRELFHRYTPLLRPLIYKLTTTDHIIEDILQDVFFKIWLSRDKLPDIENPRSWILRITFHDCFGYLRKEATKRRHEIVPEAAAEDQQLDFRETSRLVNEAVAGLSPQAQKIYLLSRRDGLKLPEIAETLGLSLQTVKNTLSRALKSIRDYLAEHGVFLPLLLLWWWSL
ncbi:sigma-70 family RNA polymerase sigma factor [Chitinophaga horti]|uniref:Sigma-70 family RNA polymerase sigma factor n=1 Tax=Chitinophaga horti TaxID=2920382 RepID=A0ABY6IV39_9BACT|nr:sigma-70 family RNA polymerase sigma factor [Chitinophaga horti]UYQ91230.1 sigma-70 family RNA polymerase sigma factor [Chitinophaga horti]